MRCIFLFFEIFSYQNEFSDQGKVYNNKGKSGYDSSNINSNKYIIKENSKIESNKYT